MSSDTTKLSDMTRSKLHMSVGGKDSVSLHRWVLLKNSILRVHPVAPTVAVTQKTCERITQPLEDDVETEEDELDSFMFPDLEKLAVGPSVEVQSPESLWLDSLLEALGDDDDDDGPEPDVQASIVDDEDDHLSPLPSPMSSSDDLTSPFYPPSPYPPLPYHQPLMQPYPFASDFDSSFDSQSPPPCYDDLPYYYHDDLLSVPDAIEDTSDDESESVTTPSLGRSAQSIDLVDPASIPLPADHSRLRYSHPYIVDADDEDFSHFNDLNTLPLRSYSNYSQGC